MENLTRDPEDRVAKRDGLSSRQPPPTKSKPKYRNKLLCVENGRRVELFTLDATSSLPVGTPQGGMILLVPLNAGVLMACGTDISFVAKGEIYPLRPLTEHRLHNIRDRRARLLIIHG